MVEELSLGDRKAVQVELERRKETSSYVGWIEKTDDKGKKERRILVIARSRLMSVRPNGGKVAREGHWLELLQLKSPKPNEVDLTFKQFKLVFTSNAADEIINAINLAYTTAFPGVPTTGRFKMEVSPASRVKEVTPTEQPLGGFIPTYKAVCDYFEVPVRDDIIWDMENLFIPGNMKSFNLKEFEQPMGINEIRTLLTTLQYNNYFKSLVIKNLPIDKTMAQVIAECVRSNTTIEEFVLSRAGLKDGMVAIAEGLAFNKNLALTSVNLSGNSLEDPKAGSALAQYLGGMSRGLVKLDLSSCNLPKASVSAILNSLKKNVHMSSSLTYLDVSDNKLDDVGSSSLAAFLASPNAVRTLNISNSLAVLDVILSAIIRGCAELQHLDVSHSKMTKKEASSLGKYLSSTATLVSLKMEDCNAGPDGVKDIVTALTSNPYLKNMSLSLADNKLGVPGARVLAASANKLAVVNLDLSENEFNDDGISIICEAFSYNTSLKHLSLKGNFKVKSKTRQHAIESIVSLINSECPLESLNLAGTPKSELKFDVFPLIYALGTNESLISLDVSGNLMGNKGGSALGKALQTNEKLTSLFWDGNATSKEGFYSFYIGLKRNFNLKNCPIPVSDVSASLKGQEQQVTDLIAKINNVLLRNQNPANKFQTSTGDIGGGNTFGFLTSGNRETMQQVLAKVKSTGKKFTEGNERITIEEAEHQDQMMANLYNIDDEYATQFETVLKEALSKSVASVYPVYLKTKNEFIEAIMEHVKKSYRALHPETINRLQTNLQYGAKDVGSEEFDRILVDLATGELSLKATQAFHSTVTVAADYLYEKMEDSLTELYDEISHAMEPQRSDTELKSGSTIKGDPNKKLVQPKTIAAVPKDPKDSKDPKAATADKKKPTPPPASKKPTTAAAKPAAVETLAKVESNLEHMTKERPQAAQGRRPPTRKARPPPPDQKPM
eukprot:TRINITY_DN1278_c0_g1_i1.p1 TRINITY_DN1278_c0_g1~~TRINITY_DN1278_c0_g1_i1.p1  ORF type:complete len:952 (+),score=343.92 TRINITY_DN1278_c0_g1_i1:87-2942(+)